MNAKFRNIIDRLNDLVIFEVDKLVSDDDFIANIDAINLLCNTCDDLGLDRAAIREKMDALYPQLSRRIRGKENIQLAMPLIKALHRYIYDRGVDSAERGPANRRKSFVDLCCKVVAAYRENPLIHSSDYLYALCAVARSRDYVERSEYREINDVIVSYLHDIDSVPTEEKLLRLAACNASKGFIRPENNNWEKWDEIRESLCQEDTSRLDDETFLIWHEITDLAPRKELKRRSRHSKRMQVEYLQALTASEFERQRRLAAKRKLNRDLKTLNDDIISDIIPIKIDAAMTVSTLYALETIFYLRLQLAQVSWEDNEPIYESLCRDRFEQLAKALRKKYATANSLNEKIEILERLNVISQTIQSESLAFVLNEASDLLASQWNGDFQSPHPANEQRATPDARRLRLEWLPVINSKDDSKTVSELLPQANDSFVMATIGMLLDYITDNERNAVIDRYIALVDAAIASNDTAELGNLLALAADWNSHPAVRHRLSEVANKAAFIEGLSHSEKRVNAIAAKIYAQIDTLTGKYDIVEGIPA